MSALWTRSDEPCTAFFTELGSVTILMLALRTVHVPPLLDPVHSETFAVCH